MAKRSSTRTITPKASSAPATRGGLTTRRQDCESVGASVLSINPCAPHPIPPSCWIVGQVCAPAHPLVAAHHPQLIGTLQDLFKGVARSDVVEWRPEVRPQQPSRWPRRRRWLARCEAETKLGRRPGRQRSTKRSAAHCPPAWHDQDAFAFVTPAAHRHNLRANGADGSGSAELPHPVQAACPKAPTARTRD
jgi:hypothetical protein